MTDKEQNKKDVNSSDRYVVFCDECGKVSFDVLEYDWFGNKIAATWYAGYHGGKDHPNSDRQLGQVEKYGYLDTNHQESDVESND